MMRHTLIIAILMLFCVSLAAADDGEDYLERYIRSRGGSIRYHEPEPRQSQETTINIYIEQNNPGNYRPYRPVDDLIYYQQRHNTWRFGSPSDVKRFIFDERRRHHRWRR